MHSARETGGLCLTLYEGRRKNVRDEEPDQAAPGNRSSALTLLAADSYPVS